MIDKRKDIQIFQYCHRITSYGEINNKLFTPIQVGAAYSKNNICEYKDNTLDNISYWNPLYLENTGLYWIWKNVLLKDDCTLKYVGQCQYRRYFDYDENFDFTTVFNKNFAIVTPFIFHDFKTSIEEYKIHYCEKDLLDVIDVIADIYPEYLSTAITLCGKNFEYACCCLITEKNIMLEYCEFLFTILNELRKRRNYNTIEDVQNYVQNNIHLYGYNDVTYQTSIFGYLAERLMTVFFVHQRKLLKRNIFYTKFKQPDFSGRISLI